MRRPTPQGLEDWQLANLREMRRPARSCDRDPGVADLAPGARDLARRSASGPRRGAQNNFELFAPHLEEVVHLVRDKAALLGQALGLPPYDALVDEFSPGICDRRHRGDLQGAVAPAADA